ncbi:hypothetical protein EDD16DRAFT_1548664, partial [Pisolithus croceorrhizus]
RRPHRRLPNNYCFRRTRSFISARAVPEEAYYYFLFPHATVIGLPSPENCSLWIFIHGVVSFVPLASTLWLS